MAIRKSSALHDWLLRLNFTIFTWELNIGDWIEVAIDWTVSWVNEAYSWAKAAYNWARAAWDRAGELWAIANNTINSGLESLRNRIDAWRYELGDWWSVRKWELQEWVRALASSTLMQLDALRTTLMQFEAQWSTFRTVTLPRLLDLTWWTSFWGAAFTSIWDWWRPEKQKLSDEIEISVKPVRDEVNRHTSWLDMIKKLFTDPEEFVSDLLERIW